MGLWLTVILAALPAMGCQGAPAEQGVFFESSDDISVLEDSSTDEGTARESGAGSDSFAFDVSTDDPGSYFEGKWGLLISAATKQIRVPLLKSQIAIARSFFLVEAKRVSANELVLSEKLCDTKMKLETWFNKVIIPSAFNESIPAVERRVTVDGTQPGSAWRSNDVWDVRGAVLEDKVNDPMPPSGSAARNDSTPCSEAPYGSQCDQDGDGHPGLTNFLVGALNCHIYIAQRWHTELAGQVIDAHTVAGDVVSTSTEQSILAASTELCENNQLQNVSVMEECPELFYFKMIRLPDDATCANVQDSTSCDENQETCEGDTRYPLNPRVDDPASCKTP